MDRRCSLFVLSEPAQRDSSCSQLDCRQRIADHVKSTAPQGEARQPLAFDLQTEKIVSESVLQIEYSFYLEICLWTLQSRAAVGIEGA